MQFCVFLIISLIYVMNTNIEIIYLIYQNNKSTFAFASQNYEYEARMFNLRVRL